jgi:hypothetical protein
MDTAIYALASGVREQAAAANGLRNLLSRQENFRLVSVLVASQYKHSISFAKNSHNTMVLVENIVIAKERFCHCAVQNFS